MLNCRTLNALAGLTARWVHAVLSLALTACFLEPDSHVTGRWGGRNIGLEARSGSVTLDFYCTRAVGSELPIHSSGYFDGAAQDTRYGSTLRLSGRVADDRMNLVVAWVWADTIVSSESYTLRHGAPPDFTDLGGCVK